MSLSTTGAYRIDCDHGASVAEVWVAYQGCEPCVYLDRYRTQPVDQWQAQPGIAAAVRRLHMTLCSRGEEGDCARKNESE